MSSIPKKSTLPVLSASASNRAIGPARSIEDYAAAAAGYVSVGLDGAEATKRAYAGDWRRFTTWCRELERQPLPADSATLAGFVTHLAEAGKKVATIQRHCAAISSRHHRQGLESPTDNRQFKVLLEGISRVKGVRQTQAPAFTMPFFKRAVKAIDQSRPDGLRDRALLLLGLAGAFRREELASLNLEQLRFTEDELIIELGRSKTNQKGEAEQKAIFYSADRDTCPVRVTRGWVQLLAEHGQTQGPLFVSFQKGQRLSSQRLSTVTINKLVKRHLGEKYSAHSLRASFVTIAKLNGADDSEVMNQTKHRTSEMIRRYTRLDEITQHNAGKKLGL